jgi:hypothetical protein
LAIVDVSQANKPILLGSLPLPGDAGDVAVDSTSQIAVVAANAGGLHLVDVSTPAVPRLIQSLAMRATQVEVVGGMAYVCQDSGIQAIDPVTRTILQTLQVPGAPLMSMAREGDLLFALDGTGNLRIVDISQPSMALSGSIFVASSAVKVFLGNSVAYVTLGLSPGPTSGGFVSVDVSNPGQPRLLTTQVSGLRSPGQAFAAN